MATGTRKTTLDLLSKAQRALGTTGIKETIDLALQEVVAAEARRRHIAHLSEMEPVDTDELRREVWER